ncbi:MAG: hypothetical protein ACRD9Q_06085, partial [Nitrososphaeraceae archaeon]
MVTRSRKRERVPFVVFTKDCKPIGRRNPAPRHANDIHIIFDPWTGRIIRAWWTFDGRPGPDIPVPPGANDWHFSTGKEIPMPMPPKIPPPLGANDSH